MNENNTHEGGALVHVDQVQGGPVPQLVHYVTDTIAMGACIGEVS